MHQMSGSGAKDRLQRIRSAWPNRGWTWDERTGCVASSFPAESQDEYERVLSQLFSTRWEHRNVARAPATLARLVERTGGLRSGQWLFSPRDCSDIFPYALWWPWGDDTTVSVRLGMAPDSSTCRASVRELFGVDSDV